MDLARAPRRNARKKGSGYENVTEREVCTEKYQTEVFFVQTEPVYRGSLYKKTEVRYFSVPSEEVNKKFIIWYL